MQTPLAVSQISLSQSNSSDYSSQVDRSVNGTRLFDVESPSSSPADKNFLYQKQLTPNAVPLLVRLQRRRIVFTAVVGAVTIVLLMVFLHQGIVLKSYTVSNSEPNTSTDDVETYNTLVGLATSIVVKPLLKLVAAIVPAVLLCFLTRLTMQEKSSRWTRYSLAFLGNLVLWLLLNGFMALHVRENTIRVDAAIQDSDLFKNESVSHITDDKASSLDTILRTSMQMPDTTAEIAAEQCSLPSPRRLPAQLDFGFPSRRWFSDFLPFAPEKTSTNSLSLSLGNGIDSIEDVKMPMALTSARNLVKYAMRATDDFFREQDAPANASAFELLDIHDRFDSASSDDTSMIQALVKATNSAMTLATNTRTHLKNFSIAESSVEFVTFPWKTDSGSILFEGVTLELPMRKDFLRRDVNFVNDTTHSVLYGAQAPHGLFEINAKEECGRFGCIVSPVGAALTTAPADAGSQVRALPICLDANGHEDYEATMDVAGTKCKHRSTNSMLVLSFAKRIVGGVIRSSLVSNSTGEAAVVVLTNARKVYEITAGRLSWETTDLASKYDASCEASDCDGLTFPLSSGDQQVIVGSNHIPVNKLIAYTPSLLQWTPLVSSNTQEVDMSDILKSDFVFPRNFKDTSGWTPIDGSRCERERGIFLDRVENSHMYSERSLQPAYQSAFFWLFQFGVVKQKLSNSKLAFDSSVTSIDVTLAVPHVSAILTYVGCGMIILMGVMVFFGGKSREAHVERHFQPHHLARILLDDEAFSHKLLKCDLLNIGNEFLNSSELLDHFEISGLALRHRTHPSDMIIVPKCQQSPRHSPV